MFPQFWAALSGDAKFWLHFLIILPEIRYFFIYVCQGWIKPLLMVFHMTLFPLSILHFKNFSWINEHFIWRNTSRRPEVFLKALLKILQDSLENNCASLFFNNACNVIKKESLAQTFFGRSFLSRSFTITVLRRKGEGIYLTPHYHFHTFQRHLDISRAIIAESSSLHIAISQNRTGNLWFRSASR